jgi:UDP-N-acetylmuramoylalanine--D-glutamate ligase
MKEWQPPKAALVVGAGKTGRAVARFLASRATRVVLCDRDLRQLTWLEDLPLVTVCSETDALSALHEVELVVPSPGVPRSHPLLLASANRGVPIWSEIELASRAFAAPVLAVTGTNGKSTTTTLLGDMLRRAGLRVFVGGNLGTPMIEACQDTWDAAVVEVSSFQLEWVERFRPAVGVLLNLSLDHLDRYENLEEYGRTKMRLFARQHPEDWVVFSRDDPWVFSACQALPQGRKATFGWQPVEVGAWAGPGQVWLRLEPQSPPHSLSLERTRLAGKHNVENIMAASLAALAFGVPLAALQEAVDEAQPLPHRVEFVREWRGVRFYDDSKGTNPGATAKAVAGFDSPVVLLAGGYDKGARFDSLAPLLQRHARFAVFFGASAAKWAAEVGYAVPHELAPTLREAVQIAARAARPGEVVLLSPGCASFDEFENYEHRGRCFRAWVEEL